MRLLRFQVDEEVKIGSLIGTRVIDLEKGRQLLSESGDNRFDELEVLRGGFQHILLHYGWTFSLLRSLEDSIRELVIHDNSLEESTELFYKEKDIVYKSLFPDHNRILTCRGLNPNTLRTQSAFRLPVIPVGDWRSRNKLIAHKEPFILPKTQLSESEQGYPGGCNPEVGIILGGFAKDISRADASEIIGAYSIFVDSSMPSTAEVAKRIGVDSEIALTLGTEPTYHALRMPHPVGPTLVTKDEILDPYSLEFTLVDSGTVTDYGISKSLMVSFEEIVHYYSHILTLKPGDLLTTSAPGFDGLPFEPSYEVHQNPYIEVRSPQLGNLFNPIDDQRHTTGAKDVEAFDPMLPNKDR